MVRISTAKRKTLKPHQERGVDYLCRNPHGALFMEMRLGKTLTAIRALRRQGIFELVLIVSPYSVMDAWENELRDDGIDCQVLRGTREQRLEELKRKGEVPGWVVSNFESAERLGLQTFRWQAVIVDESTRIANPRASVTKFFLRNFQAVPNKFILCGNPAPESGMQYATQFMFLHGRFLGYYSFWTFRLKCYEQRGFDWKPKPGTTEDVAQYVRENSFELSRKEAGMGGEKIFSVRRVSMSDEQIKQYKAMTNEFSFGDVEVKHVVAQLVSLQYICGGLSVESDHAMIGDAKLKELHCLLKNELSGQKVLVWCRFRAEQAAICQFLTEHGISNYFINGDTDDRENVRQLFFSPASTSSNVVVMTIAAGAKGGDWSAADTAIYYSNFWSNDLRSQSEDRIFHPEKTTPSLIVDLCLEDSIDEDVLEMLREKKFSSEALLGRLECQIKMRSHHGQN